MKYILTPIALSVILLSVSCGTPDEAPTVAEPMEDSAEEIPNLKLKATAILKAIGTADDVAWNEVDEASFVHHNPWLNEGIEGLKADTVERQYLAARIFQDGNHVFAHAQEIRNGTMHVRMDVIRFSQGKMVELWSGIAQQSNDLNPSGHKQMGGAMTSSQLEKSAANKAVVFEFVESVLIKKAYTAMVGFFDGDKYIQHNPQIGDGVTGLYAAIEELKQEGVTFDYTENVLVVAEGDFVMAMSEGRWGDEEARFFDLFRLQDEKLAEHWDVIHLVNEKLQ